MGGKQVDECVYDSKERYIWLDSFFSVKVDLFFLLLPRQCNARPIYAHGGGVPL